jgi:DNA-binding beta-propeller fold protein YncE
MKNTKGQDRMFSLPVKESRINGAVTMVCCIVFALFMIAPSSAAAAIRGESYSYNLANFNGFILSQWANVYVDRERGETYVISTETRDIRIFDKNGMEIYVFGDEGNLGYVADLTVDGDGNIIIISRKRSLNFDIIRCNYRGQSVAKIGLTNLPDGFSGFNPDRIVYREGKLYFAEVSGLKIVVTDMNGVFERGFDIAPMIKVADSKRDENEMTGFSVDKDGSILFTIAVTFQAYKLFPDGTLDSFGKSGGGPGAFGVAAGITSDREGNIYVADKLRCVVLVFDGNFTFLREFGYRGNRPRNLVVPNDIDIDNSGKLYISQGGSRGISVYKMQYTND